MFFFSFSCLIAWLEQNFSSGHVKFEVLIMFQNGRVKYAVEYLSLEVGSGSRQHGAGT